MLGPAIKAVNALVDVLRKCLNAVASFFGMRNSLSIPEQSLVDTLRVREVEQSELEEVLFRHFNRATSTTLEVIRYPSEGANFAVELRYDDGVLVDIVSGPALTRLDLDAIRKQIDVDILAPAETQVGRVVLFSSVPVTGYFRYGDRFQWVPLPSDAPRPPVQMAEHPFLLEFNFRNSPSSGIRHLRRATLERELELLAAALLEFTVRGLGRLARFHWVVDTMNLTEPWISSYRQEMYTWPGLMLEGGAFADTTTIPRMTNVAAADYYTRGGIGVDRTLEIPDNLSESLDRFFDLPTIERERFLRACFWFQHGHIVGRWSRSAAFTAMISAVEALIPPAGAPEICPTCKRPVGAGRTKLFAEFVDQFAPRTPVKERRRLYGIRSALSHGGTLLHSDRKGWGPMTSGRIEEWEDIEALWPLVRMVLVNWLATRPRS
jgi:hypothetical protein